MATDTLKHHQYESFISDNKLRIKIRRMGKMIEDRKKALVRVKETKPNAKYFIQKLEKQIESLEFIHGFMKSMNYHLRHDPEFALSVILRYEESEHNKKRFLEDKS